MLWTLAAFLLILSLLLLQVLKKVIDKVKDSYYVYPSDSVIDQVLPQEIMEHVMTFLDPRGMIECRQVSKYWRHHAIKPNIEAGVLRQARQMVREVYQKLSPEGISVPDEHINRVLSTMANDMYFVRASAMASKHGADLIVSDSQLSHTILNAKSWNLLKKDHKYLMLLRTNKGYSPWTFTAASYNFNATLMFDESSMDWYDAPPWTEVDILIDPTMLSLYLHTNIPLYLYHTINHGIPKSFYFIPLNSQLLYVLMFLFTPMLVHDALYSAYLPTIKSWFGPVAFIVSFIIQVLVARSCVRNYPPSKPFKITLALWLISYVLLTYIAYPSSMSVFAGMGIQSAMAAYSLISQEYFFRYGETVMAKKKKQALAVGLFLLFMMIDWKLVVDSVRDLSIFRTLFDNTVCYCIILIHFIMDNFLGYIAQNRFGWMYLLKWGDSAVRFLRNCFPIVIWMTLVAPTWRGNHL